MSTTVYKTSHDLMCEVLRSVLVNAVESAAGGGIGSVPYRACAALYAPLMDHPIDQRGRCRLCRRPAAVLRRRRCRVDTVAFPHDRLVSAVAHATGTEPTAVDLLRSIPLAQPSLVHNALADCLGDARTIVVTGTLDRRLVLIENDMAGVWTAADLSGLPHGSRTWPGWTKGHLTIAEPQSWLSYAGITSKGRRRLSRPRLLLVSLYHPENFPLPRFPLAISDVARAARSMLLGSVELVDMQLGVSLENIIERVAASGVDILGVSVTFGQHDLLTRLLDEITSSDAGPLVLAGGSLTARNEKILLERYPRLLVCRAAGEATIQDVLAYWHGDLEPSQIRGTGYRGAPRGQGVLSIGRVRRTAHGGQPAPD